MVADPRSNDQYAVDTLVEIVHLATRAATSTLDEATLFTDRTAPVRVHIQADTLHPSAAGGTGDGARAGAAYIEGQTGLISTETAERYICTSGTLPVIFSGTTAIDAGHTHRLHSPRQRIAIAAQWNGCAWPDCPKPAIMTEIHHIDAFNGTNTTLATRSRYAGSTTWNSTPTTGRSRAERTGLTGSARQLTAHPRTSCRKPSLRDLGSSDRRVPLRPTRSPLRNPRCPAGS